MLEYVIVELLISNINWSRQCRCSDDNLLLALKLGAPLPLSRRGDKEKALPTKDLSSVLPPFISGRHRHETFRIGDKGAWLCGTHLSSSSRSSSSSSALMSAPCIAQDTAGSPEGQIEITYRAIESMHKQIVGFTTLGFPRYRPRCVGWAVTISAISAHQGSAFIAGVNC